MKVSELYDEMLKLLKVRVSDDDEKRDLISHIYDVKSFSPKVGYVELTSVNNAYLDWRE